MLRAVRRDASRVSLNGKLMGVDKSFILLAVPAVGTLELIAIGPYGPLSRPESTAPWCLYEEPRANNTPPQIKSVRSQGIRYGPALNEAGPAVLTDVVLPVVTSN